MSSPKNAVFVRSDPIRPGSHSGCQYPAHLMTPNWRFALRADFNWTISSVHSSDVFDRASEPRTGSFAHLSLTFSTFTSVGACDSALEVGGDCSGEEHPSDAAVCVAESASDRSQSGEEAVDGGVLATADSLM